MVAQLHQPQTSIVDLPEEDQELAAHELLLVVGGYTGLTGPVGEDKDMIEHTFSPPVRPLESLSLN